jgi:hypothetical protein
MIHLYYLGYGKDEITNFSLLLNNPSTQQEMMKIELLEAKARAFVALTDSQNTLQPMSRTTAIRLIFGFSDKEIIDDLKKMRMERAVAQELQDSPLIIKKTTIFDDIDKKYGNPEIALSGGTENLGGGGAELKPIGGTNLGGIGNEEGAGGGGNFGSPAELPPVAGESKEKDKPILSEMDYDKVINALVKDNAENSTPVKNENKKLLGEAVDTVKKMNFEAKTMITEIDDLIKNAGKISRVRNDDFQNIENIELIENLETELNNVETGNSVKKPRKKKS